jgi:clan AA aspartic protease
MNGWLTSDHAAWVAAELIEAGSAHEFVIDTGFSGFVYIPEDTISKWGLSFVSSVPMALADQRILIVDVYEVAIVWFGASQRVSVLSGPSGCDSLLGMELLEGCRIELDRANAEIRLEKL